MFAFEKLDKLIRDMPLIFFWIAKLLGESKIRFQKLAFRVHIRSLEGSLLPYFLLSFPSVIFQTVQAC